METAFEQNIQSLIKNPFVLQSAWRKAMTWYQSAEWTPEPEFSEWIRAPWPKLVQLADELAEGRYKPSPMPQIPYPKQGANIRHYVMPSVRDQVAHLIFAVLLAPFIESRLANIAFGNRWHRTLKQDEGPADKPLWTSQPFSLSDPKLYNPYKRDYGLFRRLAQWTASSFLGTEYSLEVDGLEEHITPDQYPDSALPYIKGRCKVSASPDSTCYARLDLAKAFPSIHRDDLRASLELLLSDSAPETVAGLKNSWGIFRDLSNISNLTFLPGIKIETIDAMEFPWHILAGEGGESFRLALAQRWMDLLAEVTISDESGYYLQGVLGLSSEPEENKYQSIGIPTGLAVGGILLQVALSRLDFDILHHLESTSNAAGLLDSAYLRFVDDIIILSSNSHSLTHTLNAIIHSLKQYRGNNDELFPRINWRKAKPESVKTWGQEGDFQKYIELGDSEYITADRRGEFVTYLVERMSSLQAESILDQHTGRAYERVSRLVELARWDIKDVEVRPDTRLSFVVNSLNRVWLPKRSPSSKGMSSQAANSSPDKRGVAAVREIRSVTKKALEEHPWKHGFWRSAIQASLRLPPDVTFDFEPGLTWLEGILGKIAISGSSSWAWSWPSDDQPKPPTRCDFPDEQTFQSALSEHDVWAKQETEGFRAARASFLRTCFWRELAKTLRDLYKGSLEHGRRRDRSYAWYIRAIGYQGLREALIAIGNLERWAKLVYGVQSPPSLPWWETQALSLVCRVAVECGLEPCTSHGILNDFRSTELPPAIDQWSIVEDKVRNTLINNTSIDSTKQEFLRDSIRILEDLVSKGKDEDHYYYAALGLYHRIRKIFLANNVEKRWQKKLVEAMGVSFSGSRKANLFHLLWGDVSYSPVERWKISPTSVPGLGLSREWSLKVFIDLLSDDPLSDNFQPILSAPVKELFAKRRRSELIDGALTEPAVYEVPKTPQAAKWDDGWTFPPHPVHLIPQWRRWQRDRSVAWHATFALFFLLDGSEDFHDTVFRRYPSHAPWSEAHWLRCKHLLPAYAWDEIDFALGAKQQDAGARNMLSRLSSKGNLLELGCSETSTEVYLFKRYPCVRYPNIDMVLEDVMGVGIPIAVEHKVRQAYRTDLRVRMAQISADPNWPTLMEHWPSSTDVFCSEMQEQVLEVLDPLLNQGRGSIGPDLVVFPELTIHPEQADRIAKDLARQGIGMISGLFWREVPPPIPLPNGVKSDRKRYFVNEAFLSVPDLRHPRFSYPYRMRVQKPRPANIEYGIQSLLPPKGTWQIVPGREWLSFDHQKWGPFAIAICSDLLDPAPWASMKANILHLFLVAWNTDVDLYRAMTWSRSYEVYVNLVAVNHGSIGGSLAWTPKSKIDKLLFSTEGGGHFITTDVRLPVESLAAKHGESLHEQLRQNIEQAQKMLQSGDKQVKERFKSKPLTPWPRGKFANPNERVMANELLPNMLDDV